LDDSLELHPDHVSHICSPLRLSLLPQTIFPLLLNTYQVIL
jgi:hypothetical protein